MLSPEGVRRCKISVSRVMVSVRPSCRDCCEVVSREPVATDAEVVPNAVVADSDVCPEVRPKPEVAPEEWKAEPTSRASALPRSSASAVSGVRATRKRPELVMTAMTCSLATSPLVPSNGRTWMR